MAGSAPGRFEAKVPVHGFRFDQGDVAPQTLIIYQDLDNAVVTFGNQDVLTLTHVWLQNEIVAAHTLYWDDNAGSLGYADARAIFATGDGTFVHINLGRGGWRGAPGLRPWIDNPGGALDDHRGGFRGYWSKLAV